MLRPRHLVFFLLLPLLCTFSFAGDKEKEVAALIDRAKQASDIRAAGVPAFFLKSSFKAIQDDGTAIEGTYTETWVSSALWRREITFGDFHETQVVKDRRSWILSNSPTAPPGIDEAEDLGFHLDVHSVLSGEWKPSRIEDRTEGSSSMRCVDVKRGSSGGWPGLCFDSTTGVLVMKSFLKWAGHSGQFESSCVYTDYQKLDDKLFPGSIQCLKDKKPQIQGTVVALTVEAAPDPALFTPLPGGREVAYCPFAPKAPGAINTPDPGYPGNIATPKNLVVLSVTIGTDGKLSDLRLIRSGGAASDKTAMDTLRRWRFQPATCDGVPVEFPMYIEATF